MSKTKIKPLGSNILLEALPDEDKASKTKSGILIPETVDKEKQSEEGIVIEVGEGKRDKDGKLMPVSVKKGQRVIFSKYSSEEIKVGGKKYLIISEDNILAIIE